MRILYKTYNRQCMQISKIFCCMLGLTSNCLLGRLSSTFLPQNFHTKPRMKRTRGHLGPSWHQLGRTWDQRWPTSDQLVPTLCQAGSQLVPSGCNLSQLGTNLGLPGTILGQSGGNPSINNNNIRLPLFHASIIHRTRSIYVSAGGWVDRTTTV